MWRISLAALLLITKIVMLLFIEDFIALHIGAVYGITLSSIMVVFAFALMFWFLFEHRKGKAPRGKKSYTRDLFGIIGLILVTITVLTKPGIEFVIDILHNNPILFYCILVPFIISSLAQWVHYRLV